MEKINYAFTLEKYYPEAEWTVQLGMKRYQYEAYLWDKNNTVSKPSQADLDAKWQVCKRDIQPWNQVIEQRNQLLKDSDTYALPDYPHATAEIKQAWLDYRQALRDITTTAEITFTQSSTIGITWPQKPA